MKPYEPLSNSEMNRPPTSEAYNAPTAGFMPKAATWKSPAGNDSESPKMKKRAMGASASFLDGI